MADYGRLEGSGYALSGPAWDWVVITPSDTVNLTTPVRAIRSDTAGTVVVITKGGTRSMLFTAGETRVVMATRVNSTGTTGGLTLEGAI